MENQIQEGQEVQHGSHAEHGNQKPNLNRGMSKKEMRRVDALSQKLEPRIEKLEAEVSEQLQKLNLLSDKREEEVLQREENLSGGSFDSAAPTNETSKEDGDLVGGDQEDQANKTTEMKDEAKKETSITKLVNALQAAGLGEDPLRRKGTDALENGNEEARSPQVTQQLEQNGEGENRDNAIEKILDALQKAGLGSDATALRLVAELAALNPRGMPVAKASHLIQPSGGGVPPAPDLRAEYEKRVNELRLGDIDGLMEVKREFRRKGLEVW